MSDRHHKQEANLKSTADSHEIQVKWESDLPPPAVLAEYNKILPDAAERYFSLIEKQVAHRHSEEIRSADRGYRLNGRGMFLGFIVNLAALGTAIFLADLKMDGAAIAAIVAAALTNLVFFASFVQKKL